MSEPTIMPDATQVPPYDYTAPALGQMAVCLVLITVAISIRAFTMHRQARLATLDNLFALLGFIFCLLLLTTALFMISRGGMADAAIDLMPPHQYDEIITLYKVQLGYYTLCVLCVKLSLLFFYLRLFTHEGSTLKTRLCNGWGAFWLFNAVLILTWLVVVLHAFGDAVKVHTVGAANLFDGLSSYITGWMNVVSDIFLLFLPLIKTCGLKMTRKKKLSVSSVFLLGVLATVASGFRAMLFEMNRRHHWTPATANYAMILVIGYECCLGFLCACLPSVRALTKDESIWVPFSKAYRACWSPVSRCYRRHFPEKPKDGEQQPQRLGQQPGDIEMQAGIARGHTITASQADHEREQDIDRSLEQSEEAGEMNFCEFLAATANSQERLINYEVEIGGERAHARARMDANEQVDVISFLKGTTVPK